MKVVLALALGALTACGAKLGDPSVAGGVDSGGGSSADGGGTAIDAPLTANDSTPAPACANGRSVYLAFDGITLQKGATDATATPPRANWIGQNNNAVTSATLPPFHGGSAADIAQVTTAIQGYLSGYPMSVVTTRPTTGPYVMVAFGGAAADLGTQFTYAVNSLDCGDTIKSDVAWISDVVPIEKVPSYAIGAIEYGLGLTATADPNDCMCGWGNNCTQPDTPCTLSASIAAVAGCGPAGNEDEIAAFATGFCSP